MIYPIYCVRDTLTGFDGNFLVQINEASAYRSFEYGCNQKNLQNFAPKDFDLFQVAEFDTDSGEMKPVFPPKFIVNGESTIHEK